MRETVEGAWDPSYTDVRENDELGRHVIALRDIEPWQCLLVESPAVLVVQSPTAEAECCSKIEACPALSATLCDTPTAVHPATAAKALRQLYCNSFAHQDDRARCCSIAVYKCISMMNHSCAPNAVVDTAFVSEGPSGATRCVSKVLAVRPIAAGDQLCISYQVHVLPTTHRREVLRARYGFVCMCERCREFDTSGVDGDAFLEATLPLESRDRSCERKAEAIMRSAAYTAEVAVAPDAASALESQTFRVLWRLLVRVDVDAEEPPRATSSPKSVAAMRLTVFPANNYKLHELREVLLLGCIAKSAVEDDAPGGLPRCFLPVVAQQHAAVVRKFFARYLCAGAVGDCESDATSYGDAVLEKLVPGFAVYSKWR